MTDNLDTTIETTTPEAPQFTFDNFIQTYPEEKRAVFEKQGVKDFDTLHKSYEGLLGLIGKKGLIKPNDDAPEEQKTAYKEQLFKELGRPETPEYEFAIPEGIKEDLVSNEFTDGLADIAFKNGLSKEGFQDLINHIYTAYGQHVSEIEAYKSEMAKKLGEGKIDDNSDSKINMNDMRNQASAKSKEAAEAYAKKDFIAYARLQEEANTLYKRLV